ncbi:VOC family protein [Duganella sp. CY15W]|jgi:predicted enzyme related to lactoylglutathione lyase|uniref:VOC family protein n=1 Tax=Duganella sp. CY15W TaxID=2692172 RepID=UPI001369E06A|nr:VOC family protein [Duganella sp. CY15W]MYM30531.1 VOC family protein [Duganella sp. CY15W]
MSATLRHFAINADDVGRARTFYESVFGWRFDPWGPPGFYQIKNAGQGLLGALQERRELVPGVRVAAYETSMGVDDLRATMAAVEAGGGRIVMQPYRIEGVGELIYFEDTEGNLVGAMQYDPAFQFP